MASGGVEVEDAQDPAPAETPARRVGFAILVLVVLCGLCAPLFIDLIAHDAPRARAGVVSFAGWGPLKAPVALSGEWRMVWRSAPAPGTTMTAPVPAPWAGPHLGGPALPESGAASYQLSIRGLPPGRYILYVPKLYAGSRVTLNGRTQSEWGVAGTTQQTTRYVVRSHEVPFETDGSDLKLQIDISTFHHQDNGLSAAPVLGLSQAMVGWITFDWVRSLLLVTSLLLLACYGGVVFVFRLQDRASLYFALACVSLLPLVLVFSHDNLLLIAMPFLDFRGMLTLEYLAVAAAQGFILAYVADLFPQENPRRLYWSLQALTALLFLSYAAVAITGDTLLLSRVGRWASTLRIATLLYMLGVVIAACVRRRDGAVVFLVGIGAFVGALVYLDLVTNLNLPAFTTVDLLPLGTLMLLFSHVVIMVERWNRAITTAEQTNSDLRRLLDVNISITSEIRLEALLTKIIQATSKVIHADRSSLFLHDQKADELWSVVAEGVESEQIRFPSTSGLAGWSFTEGKPLSIAKVYDDSRFNREVDAATGYHTESALSAPVTARDGRRLGVMQALNRQESPSFSAGDVERMTAFAAQAAVAIDNATLFADVASERNYNENILSSMSSGVVTLDNDNRIAKLNATACTILGVTMEQLAGADAREVLATTNPWLMDEIDAVSASGKPKTLLDADLTTGRGDTISANLSIVPLMTEEEPVGLLILIEDITEGKRMQGAMRRFMTQKVVDQVLGRADDLLFGTACQASVLFADIRDFSSMAEKLQARETVEMLNEVFTELFEAVAACDGVLDKFMGDAIMAVYGAPLPSGRDPQNAVESALQMMRMLEGLNLSRRARGLPDLRLGIGVASGEVVAGTIGSPKRMDYTVIGDSVNLAARLQTVTKVYQVAMVVCETTAAAVAGLHPLRELDTIRVRGRERPAKIFQVLTDDAACPSLHAYRRGRDLLAGRCWAEAVSAFEEATGLDPFDRPSALMLARARVLRDSPPDPAWDGVWPSADGAEPETRIHLHGKHAAKPGRKMGHLNKVKPLP